MPAKYSKPGKDASKPPLLQRRGGIWTILGVLIVAGMIGVLWQRGRESDESPPGEKAAHAPARHLILISIDGLRADRLGCYGYDKAISPSIDALAAKGALFERHYTSCPLSLPAHAAIFTGLAPPGHRVRNNLYHRLPDETHTLAEVLGQRGFRTAAITSGAALVAGSGIERGFQHFDARPGRDAAQTFDRARDWTARVGAERFFLFIHLADMVAPYPETGETGENQDELARYDAAVRSVDERLGRFVLHLERLDLLRHSVVALTAAHGEALGENTEASHGYFCHDATTHVPLILRGVAGVKDGARAPGVTRAYDVALTLLETLGVKDEALAKQAHGIGLLTALREPDKAPELTAYIESHYGFLNAGLAPVRALRSAEGLAVFTGGEEFFFAGSDGDGQHRKKARAEIARLLADWLPPSGEPPEPRNAPTDNPFPGEVAAAGNFMPENLDDGAELPSPYTVREALYQYQRAEHAWRAGAHAASRELLQNLLARHPDFPPALRLAAIIRDE